MQDDAAKQLAAAPPPPPAHPPAPRRPHSRAQPPLQTQVVARARAELQAAERRQLEVDRMSSYTDDAFDCESPHAMLASSRGLHSVQYEHPPVEEGGRGEKDATPAVGYVAVDSIGRLRVDSTSTSDVNEEVAYGELAQPRPEIILRWKRFALLVLFTAAVMSAIAAGLVVGFTVRSNVPKSEAEDIADTMNSYSGLIMGFIETFVGLGVEEIFPVFIVYLHNLRWFPGDDPATKKTPKFKKFALTIFIPAVMLAVGSSLSAVQANQKEDDEGSSTDSRMRARHLQQEVDQFADGELENSILRSALARQVASMGPLDSSSCSESLEIQSDGLLSTPVLLAAAPKAVFGFPLQEWGMEFGSGWAREEVDPARRFQASYPSTLDSNMQLSAVMPMGTAHDLWLQGSALFTKQSRFRTKFAVGSSSTPRNVSELMHTIAKSLGGWNVPVDAGTEMKAVFETRELNSLLEMQTMTLTVPLQETANASVVCGASRCALVTPTTRSGLKLPRKQIAMMQSGKNCSTAHAKVSYSPDCEAEDNAVFLYGFTTMATAGSGDLPSTRSMELSMARLSWRFDDSAALCEHDDEPETDVCRVLHYQMGEGGRHLVVSKQWLPASLSSLGISSPISLVQLLEPKLQLGVSQKMRIATLEHLVAQGTDEVSSSSSLATCSPAVDSLLQYVEDNHFYMDDGLVEPMVASALLFLFQNALVLDAAPSVHAAVTQRRLADGDPVIKVFLTNTSIGRGCTWTGCGVLLVLTILVLALPNERARLTPPRGGNARAERFVAVQTEKVYPNLVYKKRFLIGKTGEEIKFGEFAVESVGLHHKMEEDEQIYL